MKKKISNITKVDYFMAEVKYSGSIDDYTIEQLKGMALQKSCRCDCYETTVLYMNPLEANKIDGKFWIDHVLPSNHLVYIAWAYIDDLYESED